MPILYMLLLLQSNNAISLTPAISPDKSDLIGDSCTEINPR